MTENSCGTITTNGIKDETVFAGSVGRPLPGVEVKIIDPHTLQVGPTISRLSNMRKFQIDRMLMKIQKVNCAHGDICNF